MSRKMIPVEESFTAWRKDPEYVSTYDALEEEFALAATMIEARTRRRPHATATGRAHAYDASGDRAPRKRQGQTVDAHARTARCSDGPAAADFVRARTRIAFISVLKRLPPSPKC